MLSSLYFAKAFDFVNHRFLKEKMKSIGRGDVFVQWTEECLSGRVSGVHIGLEFSRAIPMHSGVPQGSVMGLLLFFFFVNGLSCACF